MEVKISDKTNLNFAIKLVGENKVKANLSADDLAFHYLLIFIKAVTGVFGLNFASLYRGVFLGYKEKEFAIKVDSVVTVIGEAIYDFTTGVLKMDVSDFILLSKEEAVRALESLLEDTRKKRNLRFYVLLAISVYLVRRVYLRYKTEIDSFIEKKFKNNKK